MVFHFFGLEVKEICSYQNFLLQALVRNATDAMRESRVPDVLSSVRHLIFFNFYHDLLLLLFLRTLDGCNCFAFVFVSN